LYTERNSQGKGSGPSGGGGRKENHRNKTGERERARERSNQIKSNNSLQRSKASSLLCYRSPSLLSVPPPPTSLPNPNYSFPFGPSPIFWPISSSPSRHIGHPQYSSFIPSPMYQNFLTPIFCSNPNMTL